MLAYMPAHMCKHARAHFPARRRLYTCLHTCLHRCVCTCLHIPLRMVAAPLTANMRGQMPTHVPTHISIHRVYGPAACRSQSLDTKSWRCRQCQGSVVGNLKADVSGTGIAEVIECDVIGEGAACVDAKSQNRGTINIAIGDIEAIGGKRIGAETAVLMGIIKGNK